MSWYFVGNYNNLQYTIADTTGTSTEKQDGVYYNPITDFWRWKAVSGNHPLLDGKYVISNKLGFDLQVNNAAIYTSNGLNGTDYNNKAIYNISSMYIYYSYEWSSIVLSQYIDIAVSEFSVNNVYYGDNWWNTSSLLTSTSFTPRGILRGGSAIPFTYITPTNYYTSDTPYGLYQKVQGNAGDYIQFGALVLESSEGTHMQNPVKSGETYSSFSGIQLTSQTTPPSYKIEDTSYPDGYWTYTGRLPKATGEFVSFLRQWEGQTNDPSPDNLTVSFKEYIGMENIPITNTETLKTFQVALWK